MHRFECKVEALPLTAGVGPHRPIAEGVDSILFGKPRQTRVAITMRQRAKRIEEAKRLATGHLGVERSILLRGAGLCAQLPRSRRGSSPRTCASPASAAVVP